MKKPWLAHYPEGVPEFIAPLQYQSLADFIDKKSQQFADNTAFVSEGTNLSYAELERQSRYFASYLQSLGLPPKTRVAVKLPNLLQYPIVLFGILRAGMVVVNTNPLYTPRELLHQLSDSGASVIIVLDLFIDVVQEIESQTAIKHTIVTSIGDMHPWPKATFINFVVKYIKRLLPSYRKQQTIRLKSALKLGQQLEFTAPELTPKDIAFLQYTGGTTGLSKGAILSHGNLLSNLQQIECWIVHGSSAEMNLQAGKETIITALPLYHIFALTANLLCFIDLGAKNVLIANPRDMPKFVKTLRATKFSCITGVNTLYDGLIRAADIDKVDFSGLKLSIAGGMATRQVIAHEWKLLTGRPLIESYGLTEASPGVTINPLDMDEFSGNIGQPLPSTECEIRDKQGQVLALGEVGELYIRGPQVMQGFWNQPAATADEISADGWLRSGDIVRIDKRGYLYLVDREKDLIIVSGFNVYPNEIEAVLCLHPDIQECAAVGIADEGSGEAIKIFVVTQTKSLSRAAILEHCRANLTAYKIPRTIEFVGSLPKSNIGKILRRELKEHGERRVTSDRRRK